MQTKEMPFFSKSRTVPERHRTLALRLSSFIVTNFSIARRDLC